jgi:hypothetical protein
MTSSALAVAGITKPTGTPLARRSRIARPGCVGASHQPPVLEVAGDRDGGADTGLESESAGRSVAVARWEADWRWWSSRPDGSRWVGRWIERHSCLAGVRSLQSVLEACGADRSVEVDVADRRLAAVVSEAAAGDEAAARVVWQRVLPGWVTRAAARSRRHGMSLDSILDELMATGWTVIRGYPVQRRPRKVAVNIIMDSEYRWLRSTSTQVIQPIPVAPAELSRYQPVHGSGDGASSWGQPERVLGELPQVLLEAVRQGFDGADARLLVELFVLDRGVAELAARDGVSQRRIRQRRQEAIRRLTRHVNRPVRRDDPAPPTRSSREMGSIGEVIDRE